MDDYEKQLEYVNQLLLSEPRNREYQEMAKQLREVIELSREVQELPAAAVQEDEQVRFPIGAKVQAVWSEDGEWYNATVRANTPNGYMVVYDGYNNEEEVDYANIREVDPAEIHRENRRELKRKVLELGDGPVTVPPKLKINIDDPEEVKQAKRKKIHAFKSKVRFEKKEVEQNMKQDSWQQFQTSKGKSKKIGFLTGRKKESIFKTPDDPTGKVGVTGSGKGVTDYQKREKYKLSEDIEGEN